MKRLFIITIATIIMCIGINAQETKRVEYDSLIIYYPEYGHIDLVCGTMPSKEDVSVIFCCEAAYTEKLEKTFRHENIDGNHVSNGIKYTGAECTETKNKIGNTGAFVYYDKKWQYAKSDKSEALLDSAAAHQGMGFCQGIVYWKGVQQKTTRGSVESYRQKTTHYRVLAELNGRLCIIDSKHAIPYSRFLELLEEIKPTYAIYLDMGFGWNYSWWRDADGKVHEIHKTPGAYTTNWITFYK